MHQWRGKRLGYPAMLHNEVQGMSGGGYEDFQRWPCSSHSGQVPQSIPHVQSLMVPTPTFTMTLSNPGQPLVGRREATTAGPTFAAHGLGHPVQSFDLPRVHPVQSFNSPRIQQRLEPQDAMGRADTNMMSRAIIMGNVAQAATSTGYLSYLPDQQHLPVELGLARVEMNSVGIGALGTHQTLMVRGVSMKQEELQPHAQLQPQPQLQLQQWPFEMVQAGPHGLAPAMSKYSQQPVVGGHNYRWMADPNVAHSSSVGQPLNASTAPLVQRSPQYHHPPQEGNTKNWFVAVVDEARRDRRGFKLLEIVGPMRLDNSCSAIQWRRTSLGDMSFDAATFVKMSAVPAELVLPEGQWIPVRTIGGRMHRQSVDIDFLMVEREHDMVSQLYEGLKAVLKPDQYPLQCMGGGQLTWPEATGAAGVSAGDKGGARLGRRSARERGGDEEEERRVRGNKRQRNRGYKRQRKVGDGGSGSGSKREAEDKEGSGEGGDWRCEVCNIVFSSSQALGGHRTNSTDHKQNLARIRRQEQEGKTVRPRGQPRLSKDVYSNPRDDEAEGGAGRRIRLPSIAQMPRFFQVLRALIIDRYFSEAWSEFENIIFNPTQLPELKEAGIEVDRLTEEQLQELRVFLRMLRTKKNSLDINRRAVSKRIKGIRNDGARVKVDPQPPDRE